MEVQWTDDQVMLVIDRAELGQARPEIVEEVWRLAMAEEKVGATVGKFMVLTIAILFQGVLQFLGDE